MRDDVHVSMHTYQNVYVTIIYRSNKRPTKKNNILPKRNDPNEN